MAVVVYQSRQDFVWIGTKEVPLGECVMSYWQNPITEEYMISIRGSSDDDAFTSYMSNVPLSNIQDDIGGEYANIAAWIAWWGSLAGSGDGVSKATYTAKLTQTSTNAPVATILESTISGAVWAYSAVGIYTFTKTGAFTANKTIPDKVEPYFDNDGNKMTLERTSADVMTLKTYAAADTTVLADGVLSGQYIHIEIYV